MRHGAESERAEHTVVKGVPVVSSKEVCVIGMDAWSKAYFHEVHGKEEYTTSAYKGGVLVGFVATRRQYGVAYSRLVSNNGTLLNTILTQ